jgi:pimeloyl-ACP methyl ester carboxylesterase
LSTPETPSDAQPRTLTIAGQTIGVYDEGAGPALLAIHGLPGLGRDFRWLAPVLSPHLRFVRVDLPGFGASPLGRAPATSIDGRARLAIAVADALGIDRLFVLGHSMGGPIAAKTAALLGERARGLALVSSVGPRPHRFYRRVRWVVRATPFIKGPLAPVIDRALAPAFERSGFRGPFQQGACVHTFRCVRALDFALHAAAVRSLRCSTLVSWCDDDPLIEAAVAEELAAIATMGPRVRFKDGAHNPQKAHANELGAAIVEWIQSNKT